MADECEAEVSAASAAPATPPAASSLPAPVQPIATAPSPAPFVAVPPPSPVVHAAPLVPPAGSPLLDAEAGETAASLVLRDGGCVLLILSLAAASVSGERACMVACAAARVSRAWRGVADSNALWRPLWRRLAPPSRRPLEGALAARPGGFKAALKQAHAVAATSPRQLRLGDYAVSVDLTWRGRAAAPAAAAAAAAAATSSSSSPSPGGPIFSSTFTLTRLGYLEGSSELRLYTSCGPSLLAPGEARGGAFVAAHAADLALLAPGEVTHHDAAWRGEETRWFEALRCSVTAHRVADGAQLPLCADARPDYVLRRRGAAGGAAAAAGGSDAEADEDEDEDEDGARPAWGGGGVVAPVTGLVSRGRILLRSRPRATQRPAAPPGSLLVSFNSNNVYPRLPAIVDADGLRRYTLTWAVGFDALYARQPGGSGGGGGGGAAPDASPPLSGARLSFGARLPASNDPDDDGGGDEGAAEEVKLGVDNVLAVLADAPWVTL